jgi:uncharacterized protein YjbI with pentapeptide repeats
MYIYKYIALIISMTLVVHAFNKNDVERAKNPQERILINGDLEGADLTGAQLHNNLWIAASAAKVNLYNAVMSAITIVDSNLRNANLERAKLEKSLISETDLSESNLKDAMLEDIQLYKVKFTDAILDKANFMGAILVEVRFKRTSLKDVNFEGADLRACNFSQIKSLDGINFKGAKLTDSDFRGIENLSDQWKLFLKQQGALV